MPDIECGITRCQYNELVNQKYGMCKKDGIVTLKWRLAGDFGKGAIVMIECLNMELPQEVA